MTTHTPLSNEQIEALRARVIAPDTTTQELRNIALTLLADNDAHYTEADYWRESYRLAKNLTHDELGARIAVRDAIKAHPRPCRFPHETCLCEQDN